MKFTEHRDSNLKTIKHYETGRVKINADIYTQSLYLSQHEVFADWDCPNFEALSLEKLDQMLVHNPEVILLGTGDQQKFPAPQFFAHCRAQGCGLEVMANDAACRTFNILTTEDREVLLALIMDA